VSVPCFDAAFNITCPNLSECMVGLYGALVPVQTENDQVGPVLR
jgi:hypothetical protein